MLATLDATSLQQAYSIALAAEEQANDAYNRMKILHDQKALAEIRWVEVKSTVKQARAATDIARKALADANLIAPYSGVVSKAKSICFNSGKCRYFNISRRQRNSDLRR